jgi:hypothetical protein
MEIFIRGLVALGAALAVATLAWSETPQSNCNCQNQAVVAAPVDEGCGAKERHGLFHHHLGCNLHALSAHPAEPRHGGHCDHGCGNGANVRGTGMAGPYGMDPRNSQGGMLSQYDRGPFPTSQPGTVVFPQHPFARSPRDYFMSE